MSPIVRYESLLTMSSKKLALIDNFNQVSMHDPSQEIIDLYKHIPEIIEKDNRNEIICRPLFSHSSLPNVLGIQELRIEDFKFDRPFSYFVHVHHNQPLWTRNLDMIPRKILDEVRSGNGKLVFDNTLEGKSIEDDEFLNPFYESIDKCTRMTSAVWHLNCLSSSRMKCFRALGKPCNNEWNGFSNWEFQRAPSRAYKTFKIC